MTGYNGRRAPNFSQYLDDLNTIPSPYDQALQQQQQQQNILNFDEELAMFTNAEFFDFDKYGDLSLPTFDAVEDKNPHAESEDQTQNADLKFLDFLNAEGLDNITDFQTDLSAPAAPIPDTSFSAAQPVSNVASQAPAPAAPVNTQQNVASAPKASAAPAAEGPAAAGPKRMHTQKSTQESAEEAARNAADEDKRRRNTAASARFRVKKKMREQALERSLKETNEKNDALEARVSQLVLENHWLRGLVMEKTSSGESKEASEKAISDMFQSFLASRKSESSPSESKLGVGTSA